MSNRPASVTFVVILTWISALLAIGFGLWAAIRPADLANDLTDLTQVRTEGFVSIIVGLITAMVASGLGRGSTFARFLVSLLMVLRIIGGAIAAFLTFGSVAMWASLVSVVIAVFILWLLWNAKAGAFFSGHTLVKE